MRLVAIVASIVILLSGCSHYNNKKSGDVKVIDINLEQLSGEMGLSEIADSLSYIFLETNDDNLIGTIDKLVVTDERIVVVDKETTRSVYVFDNMGGYVAKINRVGRGPQEYISITDAAVDCTNERVFIVDSKTHKLLIYSFDAEFIDSMPFGYNVESIAYVGADRIAAYCGYYPNPESMKGNKYPNLIVFDTKNKDATFHLYFDRDIGDSNVVGMISNFAQQDEKAVLFLPLNDTIYGVSADAVEPIYILGFSGEQQKKADKFKRMVASEHLTADQATKMFEDTDMAYLMNGIFTDDIMYLFYKSANKYCYGFYYPSTDKFIQASVMAEDGATRIPVKNDIDGTIRFMPVAARGDYMYYVIEPYVLDYFMDNRTVAMLKSKTTALSNPIIVETRLRHYE